MNNNKQIIFKDLTNLDKQFIIHITNCINKRYNKCYKAKLAINITHNQIRTSWYISFVDKSVLTNLSTYKIFNSHVTLCDKDEQENFDSDYEDEIEVDSAYSSDNDNDFINTYLKNDNSNDSADSSNSNNSSDSDEINCFTSNNNIKYINKQEQNINYDTESDIENEEYNKLIDYNINYLNDSDIE